LESDEGLLCFLAFPRVLGLIEGLAERLDPNYLRLLVHGYGWTQNWGKCLMMFSGIANFSEMLRYKYIIISGRNRWDRNPILERTGKR
jgi:hypothetical protein